MDAILGHHLSFSRKINTFTTIWQFLSPQKVCLIAEGFQLLSILQILNHLFSMSDNLNDSHLASSGDFDALVTNSGSTRLTAALLLARLLLRRLASELPPPVASMAELERLRLCGSSVPNLRGNFSVRGGRNSSKKCSWEIKASIPSLILVEIIIIK